MTGQQGSEVREYNTAIGKIRVKNKESREQKVCIKQCTDIQLLVDAKRAFGIRTTTIMDSKIQNITKKLECKMSPIVVSR